MKLRKSRRLWVDASTHPSDVNVNVNVNHSESMESPSSSYNSNDSTSTSTSFKVFPKSKLERLKNIISKHKTSHHHDLSSFESRPPSQEGSPRKPTKTYETHQPPFKDMLICVSGIPTDHRPLFRIQIEELGGTYSSKMDRKVTHLVIPSPETQGPKVQAAHAWGVPVVLAEWVVACTQHPPPHDLEPFLVRPTTKALPATTHPLFQDTLFYIHDGFNSNQQEHLVSKLSLHSHVRFANSLQALENSSCTSKWILVPFLCDEHSKVEKMARAIKATVVTKLWLDDCINKNTLLDPSTHVLYRPLDLKPIKELRQAKVSTSDLSDREKLPLVLILKKMGTEPTEEFRKLDYRYLITKSKTSTKFIKAIEWGIPVVHPDWIFAMAHQKTYLSPVPYLIRPDALLCNVTLYISSALTKMPNLRKLAVALGATVVISYAKSCTHFIHQEGLSALNSFNKELKQAKADGKKIVSPWWLIECNQKQKRLDESEFPSSFKPNRQLTAAPFSTSPRPPRTPMDPKKSIQIQQSKKALSPEPTFSTSQPPPPENSFQHVSLLEPSTFDMEPLHVVTEIEPSCPDAPFPSSPPLKKHKPLDNEEKEEAHGEREKEKEVDQEMVAAKELMLLNQALQSALLVMKANPPLKPAPLPSASPLDLLPLSSQPKVVITYDDPIALRAKKKYILKSTPSESPSPRLFDLSVSPDQALMVENHILHSPYSSSPSHRPTSPFY